MAHLPSLAGLRLDDAPAPTATDPDEVDRYPDPNSIVYQPVRAEQVDGTVKSEEQILDELYEFLLEQQKDVLTNGIEYALTVPARYAPGGYMSFRGARILGEVWDRVQSKAEADARELLDLGSRARRRTANRERSPEPAPEVDWDEAEAPLSDEFLAQWDAQRAEARPQGPKMTRTWTHGEPPKEDAEWAFSEEPAKRTRTSTVPREPSELMGVEAASDVVARAVADAFEEDELRRKPVPTGMPRFKAPPTKRDGPYDRPENPDVQMVRRNVDMEKTDEQVARHMKLFTTPIAVLMLGHADDGPPHLATWYKWATESGRPGTKIFINHKMTGWEIPAEYADVIVRLPYPEFEVRDSAWGRASLTDVMINLLLYAYDNGAGGFSHYAYVSEDSVPLKRADHYQEPSCLVPSVSRVVPYNNQQNRNQYVGMSNALVQWQQDYPPDADGMQLQNWWVQEYARDSAIGDEGYLDIDEEKDEMGMDDGGRMLDVDEESYKQPSEWVDSFWNKRRVIGSEDGPTQEEADQAIEAWDEAHEDEAEEEESEDEYESEFRYSYHEYKNPQQFFVHSQWLVLCEEDAALCTQNVEMLRTMAADYDLLFGVEPDDNPQTTPHSVGDVLAADEIVFGTFLMIHGIRPSGAKVMAETGAGDHAAVHPTVGALRAADTRSQYALFGRKIHAPLVGDDIVTWA